MKKQEILENTVFPILRKMNNEITDIWYQKEGNREYAMIEYQNSVMTRMSITNEESMGDILAKLAAEVSQ